MILRACEKEIIQSLNKKKIVHIPGPRQVGKTVLVQKIGNESGLKTFWLNGDDADTAAIFENATSTRLRLLFGNYELLIIDEAQRITNIGLTLKIIIDNIPNLKVLVTGSSAFELSDKINEPLTGRKIEIFLFPLSFAEMVNHTNLIEEKRLLEYRMIYGSYPEVITNPGDEKSVLKRLSDAYLYKDLLNFEKLKKSSVIVKLLQALALQLGNEVSYNEIGQIIGIDNQTVERYVDLLEKAYIIFRLQSFNRNIRTELKKSRKIYFYDNGIRNSLIANFNSLALRQDTGALWENYIISERRKYLSYNNIWANCYFWRTHAQQEIDYIEEREGIL
ncbi:MAG: ATP-binding protein, partial [Draconibacterium sp.]|nr:ATP-binding protein [Draconibacterium sp.]